jgi:hypothetical protein
MSHQAGAGAGPRTLVSISVSPKGATANNQPSRKVKRDRPRSPCRPASSAARPVVIAEVLEGTTGGPIPAAIVGVSASAAERHGFLMQLRDHAHRTDALRDPLVAQTSTRRVAAVAAREGVESWRGNSCECC